MIDALASDRSDQPFAKPFNRALDVSVKQALASELRPHIKNETPKIALGHRRGCAGLLCRATVALRDRTGWLRMQSEAKRSLAERLFPAICDLQGDLQKLQGEPIR